MKKLTKFFNIYIVFMLVLFIVIYISSTQAKYTSNSTITDNINLSIGTYKLTLNPSGGTIDGKNSYEKAVSAGDNYGELPTPKRSGYTFDGWYTDVNAGNKVTSNMTISNVDTTIYAHWIPHKLTINYHANGATIIDWDDKKEDVSNKDIVVTQNEKYGYAFSNGQWGLYDSWRWNGKTGYVSEGGGWKIGINGVIKYSDSKAFDKAEDCAEYLGVLSEFEKGDVVVDLYPIWQANSYTITYDKNSDNAIGTTKTSNHTYDKAKKLTLNGFSRDGYIFLGWNESSDGTGNAYTDGEMVINLSSVRNGNVTLYAQWKLND